MVSLPPGGRPSPPVLGSLRMEATKLAKAHRELRKSPSAPNCNTLALSDTVPPSPQIEVAPEFHSPFHTESISPGSSKEVDDLRAEASNLIRKHRFMSGRSPVAGSPSSFGVHEYSKSRFDLLWCSASDVSSPSRRFPLGSSSPSRTPLRGLIEARDMDNQKAELEVLNELLSRTRDQAAECQDLWRQLIEERRDGHVLRESLAETLRMNDELQDAFTAQTKDFAKFVKDVQSAAQGALKNGGLGHGPLVGLLSEMDQVYTVRNALSSKIGRLQRAVQRRSTKLRSRRMYDRRLPRRSKHDDADADEADIADVSEETWDKVITSLEGKLADQNSRRREAEKEIERLEKVLAEGRQRLEEERQESLRAQKESQEELMDKDDVIRQLRIELQETQGTLQTTREALERRRKGLRLGAVPQPSNPTLIAKMMKQFLEPFKLLRKGTNLMFLSGHSWKAQFVRFNKKITHLQWSCMQCLGSVPLKDVIGIGFGKELSTPVWRTECPWRRFALYTQSKALYFQAPTDHLAESIVLILSRLCPYVAPLRLETARSLRLERILLKVGCSPDARSKALKQAIAATATRRTGTGEDILGLAPRAKHTAGAEDTTPRDSQQPQGSARSSSSSIRHPTLSVSDSPKESPKHGATEQEPRSKQGQFASTSHERPGTSAHHHPYEQSGTPTSSNPRSESTPVSQQRPGARSKGKAGASPSAGRTPVARTSSRSPMGHMV